MKENAPRIEKLKNDVDRNSIPCYISESVRVESEMKINCTLNFLGDVVRDSVVYALEESRRLRRILSDLPMTREDVLALEELFSQLHNSVRTNSGSLVSPIRMIEEWAITFLGKKLEEGTVITISEFVAELVKNLLDLTSSIQDPFDELVTFEQRFARLINVSIDQPIIDSLTKIGVHEPDATHVASAVCHKLGCQENVVFVSVDYGSLISKQDEIRRTVGMICCDPLYAFHHLSDS